MFDYIEGAGEKWRESSVGLPIADPALQLPEDDVTAPNKIEATTMYTSKPNLERTKGTCLLLICINIKTLCEITPFSIIFISPLRINCNFFVYK